MFAATHVVLGTVGVRSGSKTCIFEFEGLLSSARCIVMHIDNVKVSERGRGLELRLRVRSGGGTRVWLESARVKGGKRGAVMVKITIGKKPNPLKPAHPRTWVRDSLRVRICHPHPHLWHPYPQTHMGTETRAHHYLAGSPIGQIALKEVEL
jgi:hypothetical protein